MGKISWDRVIAGGLLAGLVLNLVDWALNGVVLAADWDAALQHLGKGAMPSGAVAWFVLYDFLLGLFLAWLYAAIRPRYGAGPTTALCAGLAVWTVAMLLHTVGEAPARIFPLKLYLVPTLVGVVEFPLAGLVAGWMYREKTAA